MLRRVLGTVFLYTIVFAQFSAAKRYKETTKVIDDLLKKENYDKRIRPYFQDKPLNISLHLTIENFEQLSEKEMSFGLTFFLIQWWHDDRLNHTLDYPITLTETSRAEVWLPDTFILNIKDATLHNVPMDNGGVVVYPNGHVKLSTRIALDVTCEMNLRNYPLDEQTCNITMLSYSFRSHEVDYKWGRRPHIRLLDTSLNEFDLTGFNTYREFFKYSSGIYTHMTSTFSFKRRIGYSLIQVYAPTMLIVALSWLSFWISKDAVPARIALGVTTILTIVTLVGSFRSQVPKVSYIKAIDVFFIVSFVFVFAAQMEFIAVLLHTGMKSFTKRRKEKSEDPEEDISLQVIQTNEKDNNAQRKDSDSYNLASEENGTKARKGRPKHSFYGSNFIAYAFSKESADIIDRIARVLFPALYFAFLVTYFVYYKLTSPNNKKSDGYKFH